ncbi:MAG: glycoside hydrolase, partial [Candidatus Cryptobacteroides sp.]
HGMPASYESLMEQFPKWFDLASRHPSVLLYHPYNETEGEEQLRTVWSALDRIAEDYPPVVMEERDVIHIHKYWWSLFENLGLYYDTYRQFPKAVMVDEFGGNYLDGQGNMGLYPSIRESYMRFLGPSHTAPERLRHLDRSCAKVAEYWRRTGAAGIAPFTMASSQEDGCNWFTGPLKDGNPKSVWDALTVLWSERAVSLDIWDCNFTPSQRLSVPVHLFNDSESEAVLEYEVSILKDGDAISSARYSHTSPAFSHETEKIGITVPSEPGRYLLRAELLNPTPDVKSRVLSDWDIRVLEAEVPAEVRKLKIFVPEDEAELLDFASERGLKRAGSIRKADAVLLGRTSFGHLERYASELEKAVDRGASVILLDVGETALGQGYPENGSDLGPLQGVAKIKDAKVTTYPLFSGMTLICKEMAEPESHIHPFRADSGDGVGATDGTKASGILWNNLDRHATDLWNGLRGGLIVPASDIELEGLSTGAFLEQWTSRGADREKITGKDSYFAYELCGFYGFST